MTWRRQEIERAYSIRGSDYTSRSIRMDKKLNLIIPLGFPGAVA